MSAAGGMSSIRPATGVRDARIHVAIEVEPLNPL
jgi:hypothetical protein